MGDLEERHGDSDEVCVGLHHVVEEGSGEVFYVFYVCCTIVEVGSMSGASEYGEEVMEV